MLKYLTCKHTLLFMSIQKGLIDPESNKVQPTQAKHMSLIMSIKFINGKIWVFTPL